LSDLRLCPPPPRDDLLRQLRLRIGALAPGLRLLAEGLLGAGSRIDFVASEPDGQVVLVMVGEEGDDLALLARGLAQKTWAEATAGSRAGHPPRSGRAALAALPVLRPADP
jgi:hypothetical protein